MKTISTTAIVALMTASIGLGVVAPVLAQTATTTAQTEATTPASGTEHGFRNGPGMRQGGGMGGAGLFNMDRGAEAIEIAIVRLSHAIELTDAQTVLLEALKTDALAAAAAFETATADLRPAAPAAGETPVMPDMADRFDNRVALQTAHLAALEAVQPAFTAFFDSLTDEQKAALTPERGERGEHAGQMGKRQGGFGPGQHGGQHKMMGQAHR